MLLGDRIESVLSLLGITSERIEAWVGAPCGCKERAEKLNLLEQWAITSLRESGRRSREYLRKILNSN